MTQVSNASRAAARIWLAALPPCLALCWFPGSIVSGNDLFVAPDGSDRNPGSREEPFATVQHGIEQLHAGDTLYLRGGRYREQIVADRVRGEENAPICLRNYPGETAIIDGTEPVVALAEGPWIRQAGAVYSIGLKQDIWQLFLDDQPAQPARYPNASLLDGRIFNVMWNSQLPMVKGDRNLVYNNVSFGHHKHGEFGGGSLDGTRDLVILGFRKIHRNVLFNEHTWACNNIARLGHFIKGDELPCRADHNLNVPRAAAAVLRAPSNWEIRTSLPRAG